MERSFDKTRWGLEECGDYGSLLLYAHLATSPLIAYLRQTQLETNLPYPLEGPRLFVQNHESSLDAQPMGYVFGHLIKRAPVLVVRESLVEKGLEESDKVLKRTGKQNDSLHKEGLLKDLSRLIVRQNDYLALRRGDHNSWLKLKVDVGQKFAEGRIVLIYGDETRLPETGIRRFGYGAADIAAENPKVPVHNVGVSGSSVDLKHGPLAFWNSFRGPVVIKISQGITFEESGAQNTRDFIKILQQREALLLPDHLVKGHKLETSSPQT